MTTKRTKKSTAADVLQTGTGLLATTADEAFGIRAGLSVHPDHVAIHGKVRPENLQVQMIPIDSVRQHPQNNNAGDGDAIAESITELGFYDPIAVQLSTGYIITGNHSWEEYRRQGATRIPAIVHDVDDITAVRMMIGHNRTNRRGHDDDDATRSLLAWLEEQAGTPYVLCGTGYTLDDVNRLMTDAFPVAGDTTADLMDIAEDDLSDLSTPSPKPRLCPNCGYDIAADRDRLDS